MKIEIDTIALGRAIAAELYRLQQAAAAPPEITFATAKQFAKIMGVSLRSVREWIARDLPTVRSGRLVRVDVAAAKLWLSNGGANGAASKLGVAAARKVALRSIGGGR